MDIFHSQRPRVQCQFRKVNTRRTLTSTLQLRASSSKPCRQTSVEAQEILSNDSPDSGTASCVKDLTRLLAHPPLLNPMANVPSQESGIVESGIPQPHRPPWSQAKHATPCFHPDAA